MPGLVPANGLMQQAFGNEAPIQAASVTATTAALTDNSAGTANTTIQALADGTTWANDVAAVRNNFADCAAMLNKATVDIAAIIAALKAANLMA